MNPLKSLFPLALGLLLAGMIGCDPFKKDIVDYAYTAIPVFNQYSGDIGKKMQEGQDSPDKQAYVEKTRRELIPLFMGFRERMAATKPGTPELKRIHESSLEALQKGEEGMCDLAKAIETQDRALAQTAQE